MSFLDTPMTVTAVPDDLRFSPEPTAVSDVYTASRQPQ